MKSSSLFRLLCSVLIISSLSCKVLAQTVSNETLNSTDAKARFRGLSWNGIITDLSYTQSELPPPPDQNNPTPSPDPSFKEYPLKITTASRSAFYKFNAQKPLRIIRHVGDKIVLIGGFDFSQGPALPLLFFLPGPTKDTYSIKVIDDDPNAFPGGAFLIFNFSHLAATMDFNNSGGDTKYTFQPGSQQLLKPPMPDKESTWISVKVPTFVRPVYSSSWLLNSDQRYLIFIVDDPTRKNSVIFLRVGDSLRSLEEATPPPTQ
jgi:hypothetical protein